MEASIDCSFLIHKTPSLIPINDSLISAWNHVLKTMNKEKFKCKVEYFSDDECSGKSILNKNDFVTDVDALSKQIEFIPNSLDGITPIKNRPINDSNFIDCLLRHQEAVSPQWRPMKNFRGGDDVPEEEMDKMACRFLVCFVDNMCQSNDRDQSQ